MGAAWWSSSCALLRNLVAFAPEGTFEDGQSLLGQGWERGHGAVRSLPFQRTSGTMEDVLTRGCEHCGETVRGARVPTALHSADVRRSCALQKHLSVENWGSEEAGGY